MAETQHKSAWEVDEEEVEEKSEDGVELDYLNFSNQEAKAPPRFIPAFGAHRFWHNGTYFLLHRVQKTYMESSSSATFVEKEDLTLSCFGRSPQPIKDLLQDAKDFYLRDHSAKTVIRRPAPKDMRRWGGRNVWTQIAHRPCRPMETVVLDAERKADVLRDINEYLHPATPRWYANRGIPYRRGYLFHGPPGTGKTVSPYHEFCLFKNNHTNGLAVTLFCLSWSFWT
jgi:chaperone BCS1